MKTKITLFLLASVLLIGYSSCKKEMPNGSLSSTVDQNQPDVQYTLVLPATTEQYYDSKIGNINEKATLGRVLFYDGHLSANNVTACASCHKQELAFADNTPTSKGYLGLTTRRNSPPIQNLVDNGRNGSSSDTVFFSGSSLFWDGRESNVRNLILRPISNHIEMGMEDVSVIPGKLAKLPYYADLFTKAFGTPGISQERITEAMALFIASIKTGNSKFEQYNKGNGTLSTLEDKGRSLFNSKYNFLYSLPSNSLFFIMFLFQK